MAQTAAGWHLKFRGFGTRRNGSRIGCSTVQRSAAVKPDAVASPSSKNRAVHEVPCALLSPRWMKVGDRLHPRRTVAWQPARMEASNCRVCLIIERLGLRRKSLGRGQAGMPMAHSYCVAQVKRVCICTLPAEIHICLKRLWKLDGENSCRWFLNLKKLANVGTNSAQLRMCTLSFGVRGRCR